jgi:adenylate cyclase
LSSRLSRRIIRAAFLSIVTLEFLLFLPQYFQQESEQIARLEQDGAGQLVTAIRSRFIKSQDSATPANPEQDRQVISAIAARLQLDSIITGVALYRGDGTLIQDFADVPEIDEKSIRQDQSTDKLYRAQERFDLLIPSNKFDGQYRLVVRFSTSHIRQSMVEFTLKKCATVLAVSGFVSGVLLLLLQRILITPISQLRDDLTEAGAAAGKENSPMFYTFYQTRKDELGEVAIAFCQMYHQIRHEIRDRKRAEAALIAEQEKSERLLLNVLPGAIAKRLKENSGALASRFDEVTILFADIVGFTQLASQMAPLELLTQLNGIFSAFDKLTERYGLEKIKTIGDAYMIVGGIPTPRPDHAIAVLEMAIEMLAVTEEFHQPDGQPYQLRIGINTGPVIAGVIGRQKFSYDLWGDAVNIASRMESHGLVGHIQVTPTTYDRLQHLYRFEKRTGLVIKSVGTMDTYLYSDRKISHTAAKMGTSLTK